MLFLRTFSSLLFSGVLYVGTTIALALITYLFNVKIESEIYASIAIFYGSLVNIWIFMAGIPENILDIEHTELYPKRLRFFAQYVLLPLLIIYIIILISYLLKIGYTFNLPKGGLSYLILGVSILGILTFLLLYPYSTLEDGVWLKIISKTYYFLLTPISCILIYVIFYRISEYGFTINRYILTLSSFWILGISLYFNLNGNDIRIIPISLAIITILSLFGPWSMFSVSEKSQLKILTKLLTYDNLLKNGKLNYENIPNEKAPYFNFENTSSSFVDSQNRIIKIAKYLHDTHGLESLQPIFSQNLSLLGNEKYNELWDYSLTENLMGLRYDYGTTETSKTIQLQKEFSAGVKSTNYDWVFPIENGNYSSNFNNIFNLENEVSLEINGDFEVRILKNETDILTYNFQSFVNKLIENKDKNSSFTDDEMTLEFENKVIKVKFVFSEIELKENEDGLYLDNYKGYALTRWKK